MGKAERCARAEKRWPPPWGKLWGGRVCVHYVTVSLVLGGAPRPVRAPYVGKRGGKLHRSAFLFPPTVPIYGFPPSLQGPTQISPPP